MSSNRSSRALVVVSAIVLVSGAIGVVGALSVEAPSSAQVGTETNATVAFNQSDLYGGGEYQDWTLRGETELANATWTVVGYNAADTVVNRTTYPRDGGSGSTFTHPVDIDNDVVRLEIVVEGTVPEVERYNYSDPQSFTIASFARLRGNSEDTIRTVTVHHYTNESQQARTAIDQAQEAVNGSSNQNARQDLEQAISFYNGGQFDEAIDAADQAQRAAEQSRQQNQLMQTVIYVVLGLVVLALVVGGVWWYRKNQQASRL